MACPRPVRLFDQEASMQRSIRILGLVLAVFMGSPAHGQTLYTIQNLGLAGATMSEALGLNDSGVAVGFVNKGGALANEFLRAALFTPGIPVSSPGTLVGYTGTAALAINDAGQSVGWAIRDLGVFPGPTQTHAVLFVHGTAHDLGALKGGGNSTAYAINAYGIAVGMSDTDIADVADNPTHAARFANGQVTDLGLLPGDRGSVAYGIDSAGVAVGSSFDPQNNERAVRFAGGVVTPLGLLPNHVASRASGINDLGQAVGWSASASGHTRAVLFAGGKVTDLGILPGGSDSIATAINNFGQIVGYGDTDGTVHGVLFQYPRVIDLGVPQGGHSSAVMAINDRGDMVGVGDNGDGGECAVKWTLAHRFVGPVRGLEK
jgi:probable HAF family extracellular repeat protein